MSENIRYPNITGSTPSDQLTQIKSYLHQLVDQLNYALPLGSSGDGTTQSASTQTYEVQGNEMSYYELRSLIIKEIQDVQNMIDTLDTKYVKKNGWAADRHLVTDANGKVIGGKLTFTLDDDGNLYYEVEE